MQRQEAQRRKIYSIRLILLQSAVMLTGMLIAYPYAQISGVQSVFLGAIVGLLPQIFFIQRMGIFRSTPPARGTANFSRAATGKFGLTVALFVAVFIAAPPSNPALFFSAYVAVVLTHWFTPSLMPGKSHHSLR
ncbi:ATP synthase subunit I [Vreelandella subterranea]|uniref:ATP synthase subunit I n=1 Tax=Vreelandella subterranea TaxID=416874 RepID=UPI000B89BA49|nr:ATP synthase subunit I [Halomonas subterranea]